MPARMRASARMRARAHGHKRACARAHMHACAIARARRCVWAAQQAASGSDRALPTKGLRLHTVATCIHTHARTPNTRPPTYATTRAYQHTPHSHPLSVNGQFMRTRARMRASCSCMRCLLGNSRRIRTRFVVRRHSDSCSLWCASHRSAARKLAVGPVGASSSSGRVQ
jgi:hypothetical protein